MITQENNIQEEERETRSSTEIESGIRRTRERMDAALDELGNRLNPRSLVNSAFDWWEENRAQTPGGESVKSALRTLKSTVRENPVPSLLIGAGLAWMFLKNGEDREEEKYTASYGGAGFQTRERDLPDTPALFRDGEEKAENDGPGLLDKAKEKAHEAKETVSGLLGTVKEKAGAWSDSAGEASHRMRDVVSCGRHAVEDTGHRLQHQYYSGKRHFSDAMEEYPLALGAAFAALGALTGVLLPRTRREDLLLGEKSRQLLESAKEKGEELLERGKAVAGNLADTALEEAKQKGLSVETAAEKLSGLVGKTGEVIRNVAEQASQEASAEVDKRTTPVESYS